MRSILDIGKQGAEFVDIAMPTPSIAVEGVQRYLPIIDRFPTTTMRSDVNDGTKRDIEVHTLLLSNPSVFKLVWEIAMYEPFVYARKTIKDKAGALRTKVEMGILSPNFDEHGVARLPTIKVLPLKNPYPLVSRGSDLLPDVQMATMLAGSAHAEGKDSGSHSKPPELDYEHKLAFIGAISLGKTSITEGGRHVQHAVRQHSSVAAGLTNGALGNIFTPDGDRTGNFTGYGLPLTFDQNASWPTDAIFVPKGFLHNQEAYGVHYKDASRIVYGSGLQILHQRLGQNAVSDKLIRIARSS